MGCSNVFNLARSRGRVFSSPHDGFALTSSRRSEAGATTMTLARPFHVVMILAAFLFVGAIILGAI